MILHIPHSSKMIPNEFRNQYILSDDALKAELVLMTDAYTDELFTLPEATTLCFPVSRLVVDVERFSDDDKELMCKVGMGMIYTHTAHGMKLRRLLAPQERDILVLRYYDMHHKKLLDTVKAELKTYGKALIIDCHSFPSKPLPCDKDQSIPRPMFCIGTDSFHTPETIIDIVRYFFGENEAGVKINQPYEGCIVPLEYYRKDKSVSSIMIEINRGLYMDEIIGEKLQSFNTIKQKIQTLLTLLQKTFMETN